MMRKTLFINMLIFMGGVALAQGFAPYHEPLIRDLRPKPNVMLVMDSSRVGVDSMIDLSTEEETFFKSELEQMGLYGRRTISKTQANSVALLRILKTYQHIAHFGLSKTVPVSPYGYITQKSDFYTTNGNNADVNPIIVPINTNFAGQDKEYVGNYAKLHSEEKKHLEHLVNEIVNFQNNHSTTQTTRAWTYSLSEIYKYFWGSRYYLDDTNRNFAVGKQKHIANNILPLDEVANITGEERIEYKTYEDPIRFICQQSHVLYFPVEQSERYDSDKQYDRVINLPISDTYLQLQNGFANTIYPDMNDKDLDFAYEDNMYSSNAIAQLLNMYLENGNADDARKNGYCHRFKGDYGIMRSLFHTGNIASLMDLHGNPWQKWSGSQCGNGAGAYNPSDISTSAIYIGKFFDIYGQKEWNEKDYDGADRLQGFIKASTRKYGLAGGTFENSGANGTPMRPKSTSVYLRSTYKGEPTLSDIYARTKEYFDKVFVSNKTNGRFIMDQHVPEKLRFKRGYIGYSISHNEQFWTSEIKAYDPRKVGKNGATPDTYFFADPYNLPTWSTSEKITYDQGEFFTATKKGAKKSLSDITGVLNKQRWLKGDLSLDPFQYRVRNVALGDIVNSSIVYEAKDLFHINLNLVGDRDRYIEFMYTKRDNFENNLIIAGSNDGFLNFIIAGRNAKNIQGKDLAGTRKASYFVNFFKKDLDQILEPLPWYGGKFAHKLRVDGQINIFDAIVDRGFKTTGIAGMGGGHRGIVGFELFSADENNQVTNKGNIQPLFEIDNETVGFSNLGYSYSGFSFINDFPGSSDQGRSVAVFGNGPGSKRNGSSLFFIDAVAGDFIGELDLTEYGGAGGAFTPTLVLRKGSIGQKLETIYVGDYSGKLFKINFNKSSGDLEEQIAKAEVMVLFDAGKNAQGKPITVKPYVIENKQEKSHWVYFGTGMLATLEQRDSSVEQAFYAIEDKIEDEDNEAEETIGLQKLNKLQLKQTFTKSQYPGLESGQLIHELFLEVTGGRKLSKSEHGWYLPLKLELNDPIIPKSFQTDYNKKPSMHVIQPAGLIMDNKIIFSAREIFHSNNDNACASDVVQTPLLILDNLTGETHLTNSLNYRGSVQGGGILANQGLVAPLRTFGMLTQDSYVGNIDSGYNISLKPEERKRLDDVTNLDRDYYLSDSSNIGGRLEFMGRVLDYSKYHFYMDTTNYWDWATQTNQSYDYYKNLPYSSIFGEEGSAEGYPLGDFRPPPKVLRDPKRISIRKII